MRIIQTFWSGGRDPLQYGYGWRHAEHNLMSWALSCCSLREHYDQVELYTDQRGYDVLIEKLHLPYTAVHVVYDDHLCLPQHWAYAKIKTYSMQTEPFLHVDGDVYISKPFPEEVLSAALITQNREVGTRYYRNMVDGILACKGIILPDYVLDMLSQESVPSYNMGVFGGNDLVFIEEYCKSCLYLFEENGKVCDNGNLNVLMEQIFFAIICDYKRKTPSSIIQNCVIDNGYTVKDFCSLGRFHGKFLIHILGGHKRNPNIIKRLCDTLLQKFPQLCIRILSLFPSKNIRFLFSDCDDVQIMHSSTMSTEYDMYISSIITQWKNIPIEQLAATEVKSMINIQINPMLILMINPYMKMFYIPLGWHGEKTEYFHRKFNLDMSVPLIAISITPTLFDNGIKECPIYGIGEKIIDKLRTKNMTVSELYISIYDTINMSELSAGVKKFINNIIIHLIDNGIIYCV